MDFGWKKQDPVDQDDASVDEESSQNTGVPETDDSSAVTTKKTEDVQPENTTTPLVGDSFSVSKDDSFGEDNPDTLETPDSSEMASIDSSSAPEFAESDTISQGDNEPENKTKPEDESVKENETDQKPTEVAEAPAPILSSSSDQSLSELQDKIVKEREEASSKLTELQDKVTKLDDLSSKIKKMLDEEKSLIQEISSAIK